MADYVVDVEHLLTACEVRNLYMAVNKSGEEEWYFSCPFHGEDNSPSCSMNAETTEWFCFTCHAKGNALKFVAKHEGVSLIVASRWLREAYSTGFREPWQGSLRAELDRRLNATARRRREQKPAVTLTDGHLGYFSVDWESQWKIYLDDPYEAEPWARYMFQRRFLPYCLDAYQVGWDSVSERVTLSVRDAAGALVGFKGRAYTKGHKPRYLVIGGERYGFEPYPTGDHLYLLHTIQPGSWVDLIEGEANALMMRQMGYQNTVGLPGSALSQTQARLIRSKASGVTLFYDSDNAGLDGLDLARELLGPFLPLKVVPEHERDPATMTQGEVAALMAAAVGSVRAALPQL